MKNRLVLKQILTCRRTENPYVSKSQIYISQMWHLDHFSDCCGLCIKITGQTLPDVRVLELTLPQSKKREKCVE